jgi:DNA-binding XRE family transcriptional regulator
MFTDTEPADQKRGARMPAPTSHHTLPGLQRARVRAHLTQRELALRADVATSTVARGEQGYPVSLLATQKMADVLGVPVEQLRGEEPRA